VLILGQYPLLGAMTAELENIRRRNPPDQPG
jgi:hypothetical protein